MNYIIILLLRIPVFVRIEPELKSSEGWAEYSNL